MSVKFQHLGEEWEATPTGTGHGVGTGFLPSIDRWRVVFRRMKNPSREYRGSISTEDPGKADLNELTDALDEQLVIAAIEDSRYTWRPAEAVSNETGIPPDKVRRILETTPADVIIRPEPNSQGYTLYSTRVHYQKTTGLLKRYIDTLESS
jgi:hypothetical protein